MKLWNEQEVEMSGMNERIEALEESIRENENSRYWDAIGCGYGDEFAAKYAKKGLPISREELKKLRAIVAGPRQIWRSNQAGIRQWKLRNAGY